jgi:DNA-binding NarL/FixJ family response regulator
VFTVLLPVVDHNGHGELLSCDEPLPGGSEHILVVDDEKEIRETCRMMLGHLGYTITTSANPLEVLDLIAHAQPPIDLVITDQTCQNDRSGSDRKDPAALSPNSGHSLYRLFRSAQLRYCPRGRRCDL